MGTRAIIGIPAKDGFTGVYSQSDGNPSWMGVQLQRLVCAQGTGVIATLLANDWEQINADQYDPATLPSVPAGAWCLDYERDSPEYFAAMWAALGNRNLVAHPRIGLAYGAEASSYTKDSATGAVQWAYALHEGGIIVWRYDSLVRSWFDLGNVRYDAGPQAMIDLEKRSDAETEKRYALARR